jgi:hypothetical protein
MSSIIKQLLINNLHVSSGDLLDKIKSYCFYDAKTWETISFIKSKKQRIHHLFNNETRSRANPNGDDNDDEHWFFWVENGDDGRNPQFQGLNCRDCGNYISINPIIPNNIKCFCHYDNDWIDNDEWFDNDDDEEWDEEWLTYDDTDT